MWRFRKAQFTIILSCIGCLMHPESLAYEIAFDQPAHEKSQEARWQGGDRVWQDYCLPIGNGAMGLTSYGGVEQDIIYLTLDSMWSGRYFPDADNPGAHKGLPEIRRLLLEDKYKEAEELSREYLGATAGSKDDHTGSDSFGSFSVLGRLLIETDRKFAEVENYSRTLNIDDAVSSVSYEHEGNRYRRTLFASHPDQCAVVRYAVEGEARQNLKISFEHPHVSKDQNPMQVSAENNDLLITGTQVDSELRIDARIRVRADDGAEIHQGADFIEIRGAKTVEFHVAADTPTTRTQKICWVNPRPHRCKAA
ncbi:MAG: glycoside hydrolase family 95 protein [Candidatus Competibacteraceae bacterium]|nr:glycoside hydrolase family 95 protein [Candidatus Competibacteraceae bacterium]